MKSFRTDKEIEEWLAKFRFKDDDVIDFEYRIDEQTGYLKPYANRHMESDGTVVEEVLFS